MQAPQCQAVCLGELTAGGKQFLHSLQQQRFATFHFEPSVQKFLAANAVGGPKVVFVENFRESRDWIAKLRESGRPYYIFWFGKGFTKEDYSYALETRVYAAWETPKADDPRVIEALRRVTRQTDESVQFDRLVRSFKTMMLQGEAGIPKSILQEIKTAVSKLEKKAMANELTGLQETSPTRQQLPFHRNQEFGDALQTVHELERTGSLWVRGSKAGNEGRIDFLQGNIISATAGDVRGLKALYRMFLWQDQKFMFTHKEPSQFASHGTLETSVEHISHAGQDYRRRFEKIIRSVPPADLRLTLDPSSFHSGLNLTTDQFSTLASVVEFERVAEILDYNSLPDVVIYESLIQLRKQKVIQLAA